MFKIRSNINLKINIKNISLMYFLLIFFPRFNLTKKICFENYYSLRKGYNFKYTYIFSIKSNKNISYHNTIIWKLNVPISL